MLDILIKNGNIIDGTGKKAFHGDVCIKHGRIIDIGQFNDSFARRVIDAQDRIVCPGFIDTHGHSEITILNEPNSQSKLSQGVTTEIVGNCGLSSHPVNRENVEQIRRLVSFIDRGGDRNWTWNSTKEYLDCLEEAEPAINVAALAGGGVIRANIVGYGSEPADENELREISKLADKCVEEGAIGVSSGLVYAPGIYSTTEELISLCSGKKTRNSIYATHLRGYRKQLLPSVEEAIRIGAASGIKIQISHLKLAGSSNWGKAERLLEKIDRAIDSGVDIGFDIYPYTAGNTTLTALLPPWVHEGGMSKMVERLQEEKTRKKVAQDMVREVGVWENIAEPGMWKDIRISSISTVKNMRFQGMNLAEISNIMGKSPEDVVMDLVIEEEGRVSIINIHLFEEDIKTLIKHPNANIGSDSFTVNNESPLRKTAHPRWFGTFPKILFKYVYLENVSSQEEIIKKMTLNPAKRFGLGSRGSLEVGKYADVVVYDPGKIADKATYENPYALSEGIDAVVVNGQLAMENGKYTQKRAGLVIRSSN